MLPCLMSSSTLTACSKPSIPSAFPGKFRLKTSFSFASTICKLGFLLQIVNSSVMSTDMCCSARRWNFRSQVLPVHA